MSESKLVIRLEGDSRNYTKDEVRKLLRTIEAEANDGERIKVKRWWLADAISFAIIALTCVLLGAILASDHRRKTSAAAACKDKGGVVVRYEGASVCAEIKKL